MLRTYGDAEIGGMGHDVCSRCSADYLGIETKFAEATLDNVELRDPAATDHNTRFAQLQALAPHFDWAGYFKHKQCLPTWTLTSISQNSYRKSIDRCSRLRWQSGKPI